MDKKNTIIGISLLIVGMVWMLNTSPQRAPQQPPAPAPSERPATPQSTDSVTNPLPAAPSAEAPTTSRAGVESNEAKTGEELATLENDFIEVHLTNYGGAVKEVVLKTKRKTLEGDEPYVMNQLHFAPALNLTTYLGDARNTIFQRVPTTQRDRVVYAARLSEQLEVVRTYTISQASEGVAPYTIEHSIEYRNLGGEALPMSESYLNIGTVAPSGKQDRFLQTFAYFDGEDVEFTDQSDFLGGGFLFFSSDPQEVVEGATNVIWTSLKNQFFITLLTPETPGVGYIARPVSFPSEDPAAEPKLGITAEMKIGSFAIPAQQSVTQHFDYYAGPKEHTRLTELKQSQEKAMQFGFFGPISKGLLQLMTWLHGFVGNWGVAIILLTFVVRGVLLPITLMSMKSMKKMSKIQEPMKKLKEIYPDDMQKQQQHMMELYKLNRINPVAGCLPMLAQLPIFFALFYMLRGAAELRFADFLWIADLSKPDTMFTIPGVPFFGNFPVNILPFVWLITLAYQMWTMPTPSVDNAQAKMMKFMPFVFFPFTYTFASGLVLYWSVSNVFTIGQQWLVKRGEDDFEVQIPPSMKKAIDNDGKKKKRKKK